MKELKVEELFSCITNCAEARLHAEMIPLSVEGSSHGGEETEMRFRDGHNEE